MNDFDCYAEWLRIPAGRRPPSHYELLGLEAGENDAARIRAASIERSANVRRYCLGQHGAEATRLLGELGAAFACLSNPAAKAAYDRQLTGGGRVDSAADLPPPPVQRKVEPSDDEAPPRNLKAVDQKGRATGRSFVWLRRRRAASSSGPARFTLAAAFLLAVTCGVVWSARRTPPKNGRLATNVVSASLAAAHADKLAAGAKRSSAPVQAAAPPTVSATATVDRAESAVDESGGEDPPRDNDPAEQPSADSSSKTASTDADGPPAATPAGSPEVPAAPNEPPTKDAVLPASPLPASENEPASPAIAAKSSMERKSAAAPFSVAQVTGPEDVEFRDPREDYGKSWRSAIRGEPETLELSFAQPVIASHLRVFETSGPAEIEKAILYPEHGSPLQIKPVQEAFDRETLARTWRLGVARPPTRRIDVTFRPTEEGFVEVDAVALLDRSQQAYYPVAARATSSAAPDDPDVLADDNASPIEAAAEDPPEGGSSDALQQVDEVAAQAQLDKAKKQPTVAAFAAVLKNYPRTTAAVEAVRGLVDIIARMPRNGDSYSARRALERLVTHYPDSDAAKEVSAALKEAETPGQRPPPSAKGGPRRGPPPGRGPPGRRGGGPPF